MKIIMQEKEISLIEAKSFWQKLKGFMFKKGINSCLRLKTNSIHTFFMKEAIAVVFTDKNNKILKIYNHVKPNKILSCKAAYYTYEFPDNFLRNLNLNDYLIIKE